MRTDQYIGLSKRGTALVADKVCKPYAEFEGAFYNQFPLFAYYMEDGYSKEPVYIDFIQDAPWSSGPMYFIALMTIYGEKLEESLWTEAEIEEML